MMRRITLAAAVLALFLGACGSPHPQDRTTSHSSAEAQSDRASLHESHQRHMVSARELVALAISYYQEYDRWPRTGSDLKTVGESAGVQLDLSAFSKLSLRPQRDGSLAIRYQLTAPYEGAGTITVPKPTD